MPTGNPTAKTKASEKWQKKAGYIVKSFKIKGDIAEKFALACEKAGISQARKITELMESFVNNHNKRESD